MSPFRLPLRVSSRYHDSLGLTLVHQSRCGAINSAIFNFILSFLRSIFERRSQSTSHPKFDNGSTSNHPESPVVVLLSDAERKARLPDRHRLHDSNDGIPTTISSIDDLSNTGSIFETAKFDTRVQAIGSEARTTSVLFVPRAVSI